MLQARLTRFQSTDEGTFGILTFGQNSLRTIECPWRANQRQISCIPDGTYVCAMVSSPKFGRVYGILNVPDRSAILIHSANFAGDTTHGLDTQLQGCIAPCRTFGFLRNSKGKMQRAGLLSRSALTQLMSWANGNRFELLVEGTS
jgi:hypothetical protein